MSIKTMRIVGEEKKAFKGMMMMTSIRDGRWPSDAGERPQSYDETTVGGVKCPPVGKNRGRELKEMGNVRKVVRRNDFPAPSPFICDV
jgi:hypothetical protein